MLTQIKIERKSKQQQNVDKLKRIEGRVKGLVKMLEEDRECEDILMQLSATHEALRMVSKEVIKSYLEHRIPTGLMATNSQKREEAYEDLLDTLYKYIK